MLHTEARIEPHDCVLFACLFVCSASIWLLPPYQTAPRLCMQQNFNKNLVLRSKPVTGNGQSRGYAARSSSKLCITCVGVYINKVLVMHWQQWDPWNMLLREQCCADRHTWQLWDQLQDGTSLGRAACWLPCWALSLASILFMYGKYFV